MTIAKRPVHEWRRRPCEELDLAGFGTSHAAALEGPNRPSPICDQKAQMGPPRVWRKLEYPEVRGVPPHERATPSARFCNGLLR